MADGKPRFLKTFSFEFRNKTESVIGIPRKFIIDDHVITIDDMSDELNTNSNSNSVSNFSGKIINKHLDVSPSIEITRNSTQTSSHKLIASNVEGMIEKNEKGRERLIKKEQNLSKHPRPPPLTFKNDQQQSLSLSPRQCREPSPKSKGKTPGFFVLNSDHDKNDDNHDANLPTTPSFGIPSSSKNQAKRNTRSSLSSKSNKSIDSSRSSHGGGLRLTPRNSIPLHILNRRSLIDALPRSPTYPPPTFPIEEEDSI